MTTIPDLPEFPDLLKPHIYEGARKFLKMTLHSISWFLELAINNNLSASEMCRLEEGYRRMITDAADAADAADKKTQLCVLERVVSERVTYVDDDSPLRAGDTNTGLRNLLRADRYGLHLLYGLVAELRCPALSAG